MFALISELLLLSLCCIVLQESQSQASHFRHTASSAASSAQSTPSSHHGLANVTNADIDIDVDDGSFMQAAVEQVIQCRIVLKYSYILGFYLCSDISNYSSSNNDDKASLSLEKLQTAKQLFEHQQEMLEKNNELLSELTEEYCNNIYGRVVYQSTGSSSATKSNPGSAEKGKGKAIKDDNTSNVDKRNRIINLTRITEKFMNHLLVSIGTDGNVSSLLELEDPSKPSNDGVYRTESENEFYDVHMQQALLNSVGEGTSESVLGELQTSSSSSRRSSSSGSSSSSGNDNSNGNVISSSDADNTAIAATRSSKRIAAQTSGEKGGILNAFWNTIKPSAPSDANTSNKSRSGGIK